MNKDAVDVDRPLTTMEAEKAILRAYARGVLSRGVAMQKLGLEWYGDLLQRMNTHGIERPSASAADMLVMKRSADCALASLYMPKTLPN